MMLIIPLFFLVIVIYAQPPVPTNINGTIVVDFSKPQCGKEGSTISFVNDQTVISVWSNQDSAICSSGASNQGGLYLISQDGTTRGMGTLCSNSKRTVIFGITLVSNVSISAINISATFEQFRYGGFNETSDLTFDTLISTLEEYTNGAWGVSGNTVGWITISPLCFASIVNSTSGVPPGPLTGQIKTASTIIPVDLPAGMVLQLRFMARGDRDGLGVDALQIGIVSASSSSTSSPTGPTSATNGPTGPTSDTTSATTTIGTTTSSSTATTTGTTDGPTSSGPTSSGPTSTTGGTQPALGKPNHRLLFIVLGASVGGVLFALAGALYYVNFRKRKATYTRLSGDEPDEMHPPIPPSIPALGQSDMPYQR